ncbi:IS110 family transposase [Streptomyces platensis]|uniref:IS110 family transposase n=1 Tax=Streptomyces platensis TaxID=58346 RepID=UPI002E81DC8D|nr:transposase [Streptomyces platensis]WUB84328.1 IS110 family transposase [Streptomyces platensis]
MTYGSVGKDAFVIADTARVRRDPQPLHRSDEIVVDLRIPTVRRFDPSADRTRAIHRLRAPVPEYLPALERAFDHSVSESALVLPDAGRAAAHRRVQAGDPAREPRRARQRDGRSRIRPAERGQDQGQSPSGSPSRPKTPAGVLPLRPGRRRALPRLQGGPPAQARRGKSHRQVIPALAGRAPALVHDGRAAHARLCEPAAAGAWGSSREPLTAA